MVVMLVGLGAGGAGAPLTTNDVTKRFNEASNLGWPAS